MFFFLTLLLLIVSAMIFLRQPKFGKLSTGERLKQITEAPNFRNGKFQNLSHTPDLTEGVSYYSVLKEFMFDKQKNAKPSQILPSKKTDLLNLKQDEDVFVWFGHSSYFIQLDGKKILVDPVLSGAASPISFTTRSFKGTDVYTTDEIPEVDYLFISHDHWDHLDYSTIIKLKPKIGKVICGLGVGAHFERWGFIKEQIIEKNWHEEIRLENGFNVNTVPARHFSGRGLKRNQSVWMSYVLQTPTMKIFIGGDSGYDSHFKMIGEHFGPFDLAILECGQYDKSWRYIHMLPNEILPATLDLKAKRLLPVHWGKFSLANHSWNDPIIQITELNKNYHLPILTPMIGEKLELKNEKQLFSHWWNTE